MSTKSKAIVVSPKKENIESLIARGIDKKVSVDTMERLMAMRRELKAEYAKEAFIRAMSEFQAECPTIKKSSTVMNRADKGGGKRYSFAPLDLIIEQVRPILKKHGFSYTIDANVDEKWVTAICTVTHELGHSQTSNFKVPVDSEAFMTTPQKFASALTFAKRYAFCNVLGILTGDKDDDANTAGSPAAPAEAMRILKTNLDKMGEKQLNELRARMTKSTKYTPEQKTEFCKLVDARISDIKKIKAKENAEANKKS